jgi:hypothetical protein
MKKMFCAILSLLSILGLHAVIHQVGGYYADYLYLNNVCLDGNYAFVTDGTTSNATGFIILNTTNPVHPVLAGTANNSNRLYGIDVYDQRAYIAAGTLGFQVWDVSTPATPTLLTTVNLGGTCEEIDICEGRLYTAVQNSGIKIYDISQTQPVYLGGFLGNEAYDVIVRDGLAYIADFDPGLSIINISNPANCSEVGTFDAYTAKSLSIADDILFLTDEFLDHTLVNISDPSNPVLFSTLDVMWIGPSYIDHNFLYVMLNNPGTGSRELRVYDISNPSQPVNYTACVVPSYGSSIDVQGEYLYLNVNSTGVLVFDISDLSNPDLITTSHIPTSADAIRLNGDYAYIADNDARLIQLNITEPAAPQLVSQYSLPEAFFDIQLDDCLAYVTTETNGLSIFQISENAPPANNFDLLASLPTGSYPRSICLSDAYVFIGNDSSLLTIDATSPSSPFITHQFTDPSIFAYDYLAKYGDYLYLTGWTDPISIIDISNISDPVKVGTITNPSISAGIVIYGHYLFQTNYSLPVRIYDIVNPISPVYVGSIPNPSESYALIFVYDHYLFVSYLSSTEIKCYNIANPANPVLVRDYQWNLPTYDLIYRDGLLYTCNGDFGFSIINFEIPTDNNDPQQTPALTTLSIYPNPFKDQTTFSYQTKDNAVVELVICNLKGEVVSHVFTGYADPGVNTLTWNGTDDRHIKVASGIYLSKLTSAGKTTFRKIVKLR